MLSAATAGSHRCSFMLDVSLGVIENLYVSLSHVYTLTITQSWACLVSYRPLASPLRLEADAVFHLRKLYLSYKLTFWEDARENASGKVQSVLASPRSRVRFAEESSRPFANILAHRNGFVQIVECWAGSRAYE